MAKRNINWELWHQQSALETDLIWSNLPEEVRQLIGRVRCKYTVDLTFDPHFRFDSPKILHIECEDGQHALDLYLQTKKALERHFHKHKTPKVTAVAFNWSDYDEVKDELHFTGQILVLVAHLDFVNAR